MINYLNIEDFQKSIHQELNLTKNRVRNLIWDANWWEDWRYKESILKKVIKNYLPSNLSIGTWFIIKKLNEPADNQSENIKVSTQLDILIYDNSYPVVFKEWDFVILTQDSVKWIIEVKTKISDISNLNEVLEKFNWLSVFNALSGKVFKWIFAFENSLNYDNISNSFLNWFVNHLCLWNRIFIKYWERNSSGGIPEDFDYEWAFYNIYDMENLSFSYFISNLLHITNNNNLTERSYFSFPIKEGKESKRVKTIYCNNSD